MVSSKLSSFGLNFMCKKYPIDFEPIKIGEVWWNTKLNP